MSPTLRCVAISVAVFVLLSKTGVPGVVSAAGKS